MDKLYFVLYILGLASFLFATFIGTNTSSAATPKSANSSIQRVNLIALGLVFWILVPLIQTGKAL
jgi:hypothetical protein